MADLNITSLLTGSVPTGAVQAMTASDTIAFNRSPAMRVVLINPTGSDVTVTATGDSDASFELDGFGVIDPTAGLQLIVPAASGGNDGFLVLKANDRVRYFLNETSQTGVITLTNGTGLFSLVLNG